MIWWNRRQEDHREIERRIAENDQAIQETRQERAEQTALTPVIREEVMASVRRGKTNRFGESLMLAWELKNAHENR